MTDFNLTDSFRMFDIDGKGWILANELKWGLEELGLKVDSDSIYLFVRRYDSDSDGRLRFSDFVSAFSPKDAGASDILNSRPAYHIYHEWNREQYFSWETRE